MDVGTSSIAMVVESFLLFLSTHSLSDASCGGFCAAPFPMVRPAILARCLFPQSYQVFSFCVKAVIDPCDAWSLVISFGRISNGTLLRSYRAVSSHSLVK